VYDPPEPTEEEQEQQPTRQQEDEAMSGAGHDDPERSLKPEDQEEVEA
jgi:hypothetical protein